MSQAKNMAAHLSGYGRNGDTMLMHVNPEEVRALDMMAGIAGRHVTTNPDTGLPEAFNLFDILPFAINLIAPGMGTAAQVALGAASGAASSAVEGGDPLTGALTGGVMGGISGNIFGGAGPADAAIKASTTAANQAAGQAVGQAALDGIERAAIPANSAKYLGDVFGKGSDAFVSNLFSGSNLPLTIAGASYLGSMLPQQGYEEEDKDYGPKNEWRPGEGYVPFQQAGVRSFSPAAVSPTGVEQNWISYGPSAGPESYRRFAEGGPVSMSQQIADIRASSGARPMSMPRSDAPGGKAGRFRGPVPGGSIRDEVQRAQDRFITRRGGKVGKGSARNDKGPPTPQFVQGPDPSSYIQAAQQPEAPSFVAMPQPLIGGQFKAPELAQPPVMPASPDGGFNPMGQPLQMPQEPGFADGGPVAGGIMQGIPMPPVMPPAPMGVPMNAPMPRGMPQIDDQKLIQAAAAAIRGQIPNGEGIIRMFVEKFGPEALQQLMDMVNPQIPENMGRLMRGPGDGRSDSIPAVIDGKQPAKLSTGEFVVPAKAVSKLGRGSTDAGAAKLQNMVNKVNRKPVERAPEILDDEEAMRI